FCCYHYFVCSEQPTFIFNLSLHDALPIYIPPLKNQYKIVCRYNKEEDLPMNKTELIAAIAEKAEISKKDSEKALKAFIHVVTEQDRKSTRLNSSHVSISYAVFCLKKKTIY